MYFYLSMNDILRQILKKHEYFGKYGKIHKVVINPSTTYAGVQVNILLFEEYLANRKI